MNRLRPASAPRGGPAAPPLADIAVRSLAESWRGPREAG
ncbi:hypothetical protein DFR68_102388 [Nocardia mexicana]|uniref:Uncharacterized protein n=1 Tax=Nocardia mexicana TaxID=279262 RepID=A0A370HGH8_9NOCA|nr:hypothetical protein DFR68_102388 [Nocardia mexicana]